MKNQSPRLSGRHSHGNSILFTHAGQIMYIKGNGNYSVAFLHDHSTFVISKPLKYCELVMNNGQFVRCHKEYLINIDYVESVILDKKCAFSLNDGTVIPISRRKRALGSHVLKILKFRKFAPKDL